MSRILSVTGFIILLATTGCIIPEGGRHEREGRHEEHRDVRVASPEVVVRPPEVIVR